jgi:hypothetical protein
MYWSLPSLGHPGQRGQNNIFVYICPLIYGNHFTLLEINEKASFIITALLAIGKPSRLLMTE